MEATVPSEEIYLDCNATTPVLPLARVAALDAMAQTYGNPSSTHSAGLRARALVEEVRATARRVLEVPGGELLFLSGATEAIQAAVLSGLSAIKTGNAMRGRSGPDLLLYGATEHKAVPEALQHWNQVLGLGFRVQAIPVNESGQHDLDWLQRHAQRAAMVCTMAANNETGVISDLDGISHALEGSPALWLVDGVQALGKLALHLVRRRVDYAAFSGHKLYAPKGIGLLYVREGAPFTPLMAGGGQEGGMRSGTENMAGIAALGVVLEALGDGFTFQPEAVLQSHRERLTQALLAAFPQACFNAPPALCLPTTLNFSVPGISAGQLLDVFDAAGVRVSSGSACSSAKAAPSHVLEAMGLPRWRTASSIRLSFGPATTAGFIDEACSRIRSLSGAFRLPGVSSATRSHAAGALKGVIRLTEGSACSYLVADAGSRSCVVIDPLPELVEHILQLAGSHEYSVQAVLCTRQAGASTASAARLRNAVAGQEPGGPVDGSGWPGRAEALRLGAACLTRWAVPGASAAWAYVLSAHAQGEAGHVPFPAPGPGPSAERAMVFAGGLLMAGLWGPDRPQEAGGPASLATTLLALERHVGPQALLLPSDDPGGHLATTAAVERAARPGFEPAGQPAAALVEELLEVAEQALRRLLQTEPDLVLVDVREPCEQHLSPPPDLGRNLRHQPVPLSTLLNALPGWLDTAGKRVPLLFVCRSGNRSARAARLLRRLGHPACWSLAGGLALWQ